MDVHTLLHEPLFWYSVAFVLFFVLLGPRIWRPLAAILDNRATQIRQDLDEAARLKREAEQMLAEAQREREAALVEARAMIERSKAESARIPGGPAGSPPADRAASRDGRPRAAEIASEAAQAVAAAMLTPEADAALIDRAIAGLPASFATKTAA